MNHVIIITTLYFISAHSNLNVIEDPQLRTGMDWYSVKHSSTVYDVIAATAPKDQIKQIYW